METNPGVSIIVDDKLLRLVSQDFAKDLEKQDLPDHLREFYKTILKGMLCAALAHLRASAG